MAEVGSTTGGSAIALALAELADVSTRLVDACATPLEPVTSRELPHLLEGLERVRRQLDAVDARVVAELCVRGTAGDYGASSTTALISQFLAIDPGAARARVKRADRVGPKRALSGEPLPPTYPVVADAMAAGDVSAAHADVITAAVEDLPDAVEAVYGDEVESVLTDASRELPPREVAQLGREIAIRLDPDGTEPKDKEQQRRRAVDLVRRRDGSYRLDGRLTPEAGLVWQAILDAVSAPQHVDLDAADGGAQGDEAQAGADGGAAAAACLGTVLPDDRAAAQRRHDGFFECGLRLLRSETLPDAGGLPVTVTVTTTAEEIVQNVEHPGAGVAWAGHGDLVPLRLALRLGGADTAITVVTLDRVGAVLCEGRERRLASRAQRRALAARDGGCCFPGCTRPPSWCEAHHVIEWLVGGDTDIDNLVLLCRYHHRHVTDLDWQLAMADGMPEWTPPAWLDPEQRPRRNSLHYRPDPLAGLRPPPCASTARTEPEAELEPSPP